MILICKSISIEHNFDCHLLIFGMSVLNIRTEVFLVSALLTVLRRIFGENMRSTGGRHYYFGCYNRKNVVVQSSDSVLIDIYNRNLGNASEFADRLRAGLNQKPNWRGMRASSLDASLLDTELLSLLLSPLHEALKLFHVRLRLRSSD